MIVNNVHSIMPLLTAYGHIIYSGFVYNTWTLFSQIIFSQHRIVVWTLVSLVFFWSWTQLLSLFIADSASCMPDLMLSVRFFAMIPSVICCTYLMSKLLISSVQPLSFTCASSSLYSFWHSLSSSSCGFRGSSCGFRAGARGCAPFAVLLAYSLVSSLKVQVVLARRDYQIS